MTGTCWWRYFARALRFKGSDQRARAASFTDQRDSEPGPGPGPSLRPWGPGPDTHTHSETHSGDDGRTQSDGLQHPAHPLHRARTSGPGVSALSFLGYSVPGLRQPLPGPAVPRGPCHHSWTPGLLPAVPGSELHGASPVRSRCPIPWILPAHPGPGPRSCATSGGLPRLPAGGGSCAGPAAGATEGADPHRVHREPDPEAGGAVPGHRLPWRGGPGGAGTEQRPERGDCPGE